MAVNDFSVAHIAGNEPNYLAYYIYISVLPIYLENHTKMSLFMHALISHTCETVKTDSYLCYVVKIPLIVTVSLFVLTETH